MPTLAEALDFVRNPGTSDAQLRRACAILFLDTAGSPDELRRRLLECLEALDVEQAVVCLNPRLTQPEA